MRTKDDFNFKDSYIDFMQVFLRNYLISFFPKDMPVECIDVKYNRLPVQSMARAETLRSCNVTETLLSTAHTFLHDYTQLWVSDTVIHSWSNSNNKQQFIDLFISSLPSKAVFLLDSARALSSSRKRERWVSAISLAAAQNALKMDFFKYTRNTKTSFLILSCVHKKWEIG